MNRSNEKLKLIEIISSVVSVSSLSNDDYAETIENIADALLKGGMSVVPKSEAEQWLNDINNPLEPLKIYSVLQSELMKLNYRKESNPQSISPLDYTIIACLQKCYEESKEIIRCKNCVYYDAEIEVCEFHSKKASTLHGSRTNVFMRPDDYCSRGERKNKL